MGSFFGTLLDAIVPAVANHIFTWLDTRALVIPQSALPAVSSQLNTTPEALRQANEQIAGEATSMFAALANSYMKEHGIL